MRWIYLSPHFDDAVLSCGGLIWEQTHSGLNVEIWTVCAGDSPAGPGSDFARELHQRWRVASAEEAVALRRIEDQNAARRVGAVARHLCIPDAIYRRTPTGSLMYPEVFTPLHPRETAIVDQLTGELSQKLTQYDTVVCPLAIGGHVDHRLTRAAAERLNRPLWYYADVPYTLNHPEELPSITTNMASTNFYVSPQGLAGWQDSIATHASQISSLFEDLQDMRRKIRGYRDTNNGQVLWERT